MDGKLFVIPFGCAQEGSYSCEFARWKNVHAIGDRANGLVLDAFEVALKDVNVTSLRPRLEHAQILATKDVARFGDLGGA